MAFSYTAKAQQKGKTSTILNLPNFDKKKFHYGFQLGFVSSPVGLDPSENAFQINGTDTTAVYITPQTTASFLLGFLMNIKLSDDNHWHLRISPNVSFYSRRFTIDSLGYNLPSSDDIIIDPNRDLVQLQSNTSLEIPIMFKYQSKRRKNHRLYLLGGLTPSFTVATKQESTREEFWITLKEYNLSFTWGFGMHIYNRMFCLSPEIRISHGLLNVADPVDTSLYMHTVDAIRLHKISFIINFEG
ncbi:outer membrane beta-barrel protein [Flammeovirga sp. SubArs3]|uniref:type IX secretion/gliding motility protein PorT/SprT n=1 Tax=Flammeovirga sp. SubArs3 TaxID=2995316 RepID=UPI00248B9F72|nr:outer membrane beta-barrel protein [Flammeovirga sp. SubArs3]